VKLFATAFLLGSLLALPALAKSPDLESGSSDAVTVTKHFDFEDDFVEGEMQRPDGDLIVSNTKARHKSLIELRTDFIPEMIKSLEDL
jgi:hypothetical protein